MGTCIVYETKMRPRHKDVNVSRSPRRKQEMLCLFCIPTDDFVTLVPLGNGIALSCREKRYIAHEGFEREIT